MSRGLEALSHSSTPTPCSPSADGAPALPVLVRSYIRHNRPKLLDQLRYFERLPSLECAVETAAIAKDSRGKRLHHQRRLTRSALTYAKENLLSSLPRIRNCRSFDQLHQLVDKSVCEIRGLGELYVYDTSIRVGAHLNLWPEQVYLHAGARKGAKALGFSGGVSRVKPRDMPVAIQELKPHEIEDFLCIYKLELAKLRTGGTGSQVE